MAVTRSFLRGLGLDEEKVSAIIEAHTETVDGLKAQISEANTRQTEAVDALKQFKEAGWEQKYNDLNGQFEQYKTEQNERAVNDAKSKAYTDLLKTVGVSDKRIASILKVTDIKGLELDDDGTIKDAKKHTDAIKQEWSDFISVKETHGAEVKTPPKTESGTASVTQDEFKKMSYSQRLELYNKDPEAYKQLKG